MALRNGKRAAILTAAVVGVAVVSQASASTYNWVASASPSAWNVNTAWTSGDGGTTFPQAAGDTANVNTADITATQTLNLNQSVVLTTLNIGDTNGTNGYTIASGTGTNTVTFQGVNAGDPTAINLGAVSTATTTISAGVVIGGTSPLTITGGAAGQKATFSGVTNLGSNTITVKGGLQNTAPWSPSGGITGAGTVILSSLGGLSPGSTNTFTGTYIVNSGTAGSSNSGGLTIGTAGSISNVSSLVLNGYMPQGLALPNIGSGVGAYYGTIGVYEQGSGSGMSVNPGQRLTSGTVTLNGGYVCINNTAVTINTSGSTWQQGLEKVVDNTATLNFNNGYGLVSIGASTNTQGTRWNLTTVSRTAGSGATGYMLSGTLGGTARVTATNGASLGVGGGGAVGSTTMNIIPWMYAANANGSQCVPSAFATYDTTVVGGEPVGFRALTAAEQAGSLTAGATANVLAGSLALASDATVNSLFTAYVGSGNMGAGRTLTVTSGGVFIGQGGTNGNIGTAGSATAGTLNFGSAEGIVYVSSSGGSAQTGTIGAVVNGTGGLTKSGTGILVLAGANTYSGKTIVGSGRLQVGNGVQTSNLGTTGDVEVAQGATLQITSTTNVINDAANVALDQIGVGNGMMSLGTGVNETIGGLSLGGVLQVAGTYGSTASGATFQNNTYFDVGGTGILTVVGVPEPAAMALMGIGALTLLRRRRAH